MTDQINIVNLPPTQYLVLEVLAARARTGEHLWTFPSNLGPALRALEDARLISTMNGVAPASIRARLTETGRAYALKSHYVPPVIEIYDTAFDQINGSLREYRGSKALREGVQAAVEGARLRLGQTCTAPKPDEAVQFCNWCPEPSSPDPRSHPGGQPAHIGRSDSVLNSSEACPEETHSWRHFTAEQVDSYWIRCTLAVPHDEHEDENTGLTWVSQAGPDTGSNPSAGDAR